MIRSIAVRSQERRASFVAALLAAGLLAAQPVLAQDASGDPGATAGAAPFTAATIAAPGSDPLGVPYADWAARWWAWFLGIPLEGSPAVADTCDTGQPKGVTYIPHTFFGTEHAVTCRVPAGQPVLVSGGGSVCNETEGETVEELAACVAESDATILDVSVTVDGQPVPDLAAHQVTSGAFDLVLPEGNVFELPAGTSPAVASGWFVMLSDLAPGSHTIVVRDETTDEAGAALAAQLTATVVVDAKAEASMAAAGACTLATDRAPAWEETFYLSGTGWTPGADLQLTFIEPSQTWVWGGPDGDMQPSGLRIGPDGTLKAYDIAFTDGGPEDVGPYTIEATDGACTASVQFELGAP